MKKIIWSEKAIDELDQILQFWLRKNKSNTYPNRILVESDKIVKLIGIHPEIGIGTNFPEVKMKLVLNRFYIVYRFNNESIYILKCWDCRQDPSSNKFLK